MELIWQEKGTKNCGQICVAMITGFPLNEVEELYGHNSYTNMVDAKGILEGLGYTVGDIVKVDNRKKYELPRLAFVRICRHGRKYGHFVVHYDGKFYNSTEGIYPTRAKFDTHNKEKGYRISHYMEVETI